MYAIIEAGGRQYRVSEGDKLKIEKIDNKKSVTFNNVLMISDGDNIQYGTPYVKSAKVAADVVETSKDKKVLVFKQKTRKNHRKLNGHRQWLTTIKIKSITTN